MQRKVFFAVAVVSLFAVPALAQTYRPLPDHADVVDGHGYSTLPFGGPSFRTQILVDGAALATNGAILQGIAFRADRAYASLAAQVPNVTVRVSDTSVAVGAMSTTFAANVTGPVTTVFQGTVTLPAGGAVGAGPLPWNVSIPFAQPYSFLTAAGNLLIEIAANNPIGGGAATYILDAVQAGGTMTSFGAFGVTQGMHTLLLFAPTAIAIEPRHLSPGHTIPFVSGLVYAGPPVASPGVVGLGLAPLPTPCDLGPFGAPGYFAYVDTLVCSPHSWGPAFFGVTSTFSVPVPGNPMLIGTTIYAQSAVFVPTANPLGLVASNVVETRIGDEFEALPLRQLDGSPSAPTGVLLRFYSSTPPEYGAVAIRFEGTFF